MKNEMATLIALCHEGKAAPRSDSRKVETGDIFVALPGSKADGAAFAAEAVKNGAAYIVCGMQAQASVAEAAQGAQIFPVADPRGALWQLARAFYHTDESSIKIIGITGTNGKTTCAWLLEHLLTSLGHVTGLLGTISHRWPGHDEPASLTTPDPLELHYLLAQMREAAVDTVIMEVSSHALAQQRVNGLNFSGAIFTNLTQDHLDFHRDMESYFRAKARLFLTLPNAGKAMAINSDDRYGRRLIELAPEALPFGLQGIFASERQLRGEILSHGPQGMKLGMSLGKRRWELQTPLIGAFNASNLLAVQALALKMGVQADQLKALESFRGVPGRLERVENAKGLHVVVDYAHTPDALANALKALRGAGFKRIITVFGCGGNRDRDKRPLMGKAVADYSDVAILTSDNPRMEAPEAIMRDVKPGLAKSRHALFEVDRRQATARGLAMLNADDVLLIAGKGHENYQIIGEEKHHYSDQEVVREILGCA